MWFIDQIFSLVWDIAEWFYDAYLEVNDWVWPFYNLALPLYRIHQLCYFLLDSIAVLSDWTGDIQDAIGNLLSFQDIWDYFLDWFVWAAAAYDWVYNAWYNVSSIIDTWWGSTSEIVQGWIYDVRQYAAGLVADVMVLVTTLQAAWDNFKGKIPSFDAILDWWGNWTGELLSVIIAWWAGALQDVQDLIGTAFVVRADLWAGWQEMRDQVIEFFTDPLEVLWSKAADWFLGPEE